MPDCCVSALSAREVDTWCADILNRPVMPGPRAQVRNLATPEYSDILTLWGP